MAAFRKEKNLYRSLSFLGSKWDVQASPYTITQSSVRAVSPLFQICIQTLTETRSCSFIKLAIRIWTNYSRIHPEAQECKDGAIRILKSLEHPGTYKITILFIDTLVNNNKLRPINFTNYLNLVKSTFLPYYQNSESILNEIQLHLINLFYTLIEDTKTQFYLYCNKKNLEQIVELIISFDLDFLPKLLSKVKQNQSLIEIIDFIEKTIKKIPHDQYKIYQFIALEWWSRHDSKECIRWLDKLTNLKKDDLKKTKDFFLERAVKCAENCDFSQDHSLLFYVLIWIGKKIWLEEGVSSIPSWWPRLILKTFEGHHTKQLLPGNIRETLDKISQILVHPSTSKDVKSTVFLILKDLKKEKWKLIEKIDSAFLKLNSAPSKKIINPIHKPSVVIDWGTICKNLDYKAIQAPSSSFFSFDS